MLAKDKMRPVGIPLEPVDNPPVRRDKIDTYMLRGIAMGGQPVGFRRSTQTLLLGGDDWTAAQWIQFRSRVDALMLHEGMVKKGPEPNKARASDFLSANVERIIATKRGRLRPAPWWLRWLFDMVVTKEDLHDYG